MTDSIQPIDGQLADSDIVTGAIASGHITDGDESGVNNDDSDDTDNVGTSVRIAQARLANTALSEARSEINKLGQFVDSIKNMIPTDFGEFSLNHIGGSFIPFSHVTKEVRNKMLEQLSEQLGAVEDSVKAAFRATKSVKRARLTDEQVDALIMKDFK